MKLKLYSDLHLEFGNFVPPEDKDDKDTVLLLAGDVGVGKKEYTYKSFLRYATDQFRAVVYVPGNHEYYHGSWRNTWEKMKERVEPATNLHMVNDETVILDNVAFVASTMWTNFEDEDRWVMQQAEQGMNDYRTVRRGEGDDDYAGTLRPIDTLAAHKNSVKKIFEEVALYKGLGFTVVVVTHHAPSWRSVAPRYGNDSLNGAYVSNLEDQMLATKPDLWVHGHVHSTFDYHVGDTRVMTNPRGYVSPNYEGKPGNSTCENSDFDEHGLQIELDEGGADEQV